MEDNDKKWIIGFAATIGLLFIVVLIISIYSRKNKDGTTELKYILGYLSEKMSKIADIDFRRIKIFERDRRTYLSETLLEWNNDPDIFVEVCNFAVRLLKLYHKDPAVGIYMTVANDIIRQIYNRVLRPNNYRVIKTSHGTTNWRVLIYLLRLLNTFEYLADESFAISKEFCHDEILNLVPECKRLHSKELVLDENAIYTTTSRLLTNYLFNKKLYDADIKTNGAMKILQEKFNLLEKSKEKRDKFILYISYNAIYKVFRSWN